MYNKKMKVILASNSPRRRQLLGKILPQFEVIPAVAEEQSAATEPRTYAEELAVHKAKEVFSSHPDALVIGCDTVVDMGGSILGKPHDKAHAAEMLRMLSGKTHAVHTGVCMVWQKGEIRFCETTLVTFRRLDEQDISRYVESGSPMDKAGAYGIQDCDFATTWQGSYDNVVGFPTEEVRRQLQNIYKG